jgi:hypothetical protein
MRDSTLVVPWFADHSYVICLFLVACVCFHFLLVKIYRLSSIAWKRVDYIWLTMAFIGISVNVEKNHIEISKNLYDQEVVHANAEYEEIIHAVDFGRFSGVYCRTFVQGSASPPPAEFAKIQHEHDEQCTWFKKFGKALELRPKNHDLSIDLVQIVGKPPDSEGKDDYKYILYSISNYNDAVADLQQLKNEEKNTNLEEVLRFLGPIFLALALALRMTKVTGEIAIEVAKTKGIAPSKGANVAADT